MIALLLVLVLVTPAAASPSREALCAAPIQRASGRLANCLLRADARLVVSGNTSKHESKVDKCRRAFARAHDKALRGRGAPDCPDETATELGDAVLASTSALTTAILTDKAGPGVPRLGPMTTAVQGINYEPAPSDYVIPPQPIYFDTDFYNQDFVQLWGPGTPPNQPNGRNDMADILSLGINFVRVFNWDPGGPVTAPFRNHQAWLDWIVDEGGKRIFIGAAFANGLRATPEATLVVDQFNSFTAAAKAQVAVWLVGNEIAANDPFTAQTLAVIEARAQPPLDAIPICVPFQMGGIQDALQKVQTSREQFVAAGVGDRFLACFNFYGLGQPASSKAPDVQLEEFIDGFFADDYVKTNSISLLLTEFGINFDRSSGVEPNAGGDAAVQGQYLSAMLARSKTLQATYPRFLGEVVFEYTNESWKTPVTERSFGLYGLTPQAPPLTGRTTRASDPPYPVDTRVVRPQHQAVVDNY